MEYQKEAYLGSAAIKTDENSSTIEINIKTKEMEKKETVNEKCMPYLDVNKINYKIETEGKIRFFEGLIDEKDWEILKSQIDNFFNLYKK